MYGGSYQHYPPAIPEMYGPPSHPMAHHHPPPHPHMQMHPRPPFPMQHGEPTSPSIDMYQATIMKYSYPGTMHYQQPSHQHYQQPPPPIEQIPTSQNQTHIAMIESTKTVKITKQIAGPDGTTTQEQRKTKSPTHDFTGADTSFTGIGTCFETPKAKASPKPRGKYFCEVCKIDLLKDETYQSHIQGIIHTRKAAEKDGKTPTKTSPSTGKSDEQKTKVFKDLREKYPDHYCEVCDTTMTSEMVYQQHVQGMRHQKNVRYRANGGPILRGRGSRKLPLEQQEAERNLRCQKMLDAHEEPLIGLQMMTEFTKNNPNVEERYVCDICNGKCDPRTLLPHIVGAKHRYNYIKYQHAELFEPHAEAFKSMRKAEKTQLMGELALLVAEKEGEPQRMKAKVEIDPFYNPNKDKKNHPSEAQKRTQDAKEAGQPPSKRVPKAKVTPNWGGPDPSKHLKQTELAMDMATDLTNEEDAGDGYRGNTEKPNEENIVVAQTQIAKPVPTALPKNLNEVMQNLSQCLVNNEHEASMALQVSNTLTQALLQYRLKNLKKEAIENKTK